MSRAHIVMEAPSVTVAANEQPNAMNGTCPVTHRLFSRCAQRETHSAMPSGNAGMQ